MNSNPQPDIIYRLATEADFPVITGMYAKLNAHLGSLGYNLPRPENVGQLWLESFQRTLGRFSNAWVAEIDNVVVGFILCRIKRLPVYMDSVMVGELSDEWIEKSARHFGIGDKLCRIALTWLQEQDVHSVEIQVLNANQASWNMLSQMGFEMEFRVGRLLWDNYKEKPPG
jgi:ribosomal protein S18 acetylase RimI-like enzyme